MTRWLQAANASRNLNDKTDKTDKTTPGCTQPVLTEPQDEVLSVLSVLSIDVHASSETNTVASSGEAHDRIRQGQRDPAMPRTWTGRVVSLDEWRSMSAWDRHGPNGRVFCGIARKWRDPDET